MTREQRHLITLLLASLLLMLAGVRLFGAEFKARALDALPPIGSFGGGSVRSVPTAPKSVEVIPQVFSLLNYYPGWYFAPLPANTFAFPYRGGSFPAFVVQTNGSPQNIAGLAATFRVSATGDARFTFGGEDRWNTGTLPPHARLFFSSRLGYAAEDGCPECSWWSEDGWAVITNGVVTITAPLDPARWTDSHGHHSTNDFFAALTNVIECGVSFGGGSFFDIGVGMTAGNATFEILALDFLPGTGQLSLSLTNGLNRIESSTDLTNWQSCIMRVGPCIMHIPIGSEPYRFWRAGPL